MKGREDQEAAGDTYLQYMSPSLATLAFEANLAY